MGGREGKHKTWEERLGNKRAKRKEGNKMRWSAGARGGTESNGMKEKLKKKRERKDGREVDGRETTKRERASQDWGKKTERRK